MSQRKISNMTFLLCMLAVFMVLDGCAGNGSTGTNGESVSTGDESGLSVSGSVMGDSAVSGSSVSGFASGIQENSVSGGAGAGGSEDNGEGDKAQKKVEVTEKKKSKERAAVWQVGVSEEYEYADFDKQLEIIWENRDEWLARKKNEEGDGEDGTDSEEEDDFSESFDYEPYTKYIVTDLDRNGRLELISSETNGNGGYFDNKFFEVDEDEEKLISLEFESGEEAEGDCTLPLLYAWGSDTTSDDSEKSHAPEGYYDIKKDVWHYTLTAHSHSSANYNDTYCLDFVLKNGKIKITLLGRETVRPDEAKKSGVKISYYDGSGKKIKGSRLAENQKKFYKGMMECHLNVSWFMSCKTSYKQEEYKKQQFSDEKIYDRVVSSWSSFYLAPENLKSWKQIYGTWKIKQSIGSGYIFSDEELEARGEIAAQRALDFLTSIKFLLCPCGAAPMLSRGTISVFCG